MKTDELKEILEKYKENFGNYKKEYNLFDILKIYENSHSNLLAWLFDIKDSDDNLKNLKNNFIEKFFEFFVEKERCGELYGKLPTNKHNLTIDTEHKTDSGKRIDILLYNANFVCVIENKFGSKPYDNQCKEYKDYIENSDNFKNKKEKLCVFIDIYPPAKTIEDDIKDYNVILYDDISTIIKNCIKNSQIEEKIKKDLEQYCNYLDSYYSTIEINDDKYYIGDVYFKYKKYNPNDKTYDDIPVIKEIQTQRMKSIRTILINILNEQKDIKFKNTNPNDLINFQKNNKKYEIDNGPNVKYDSIIIRDKETQTNLIEIEKENYLNELFYLEENNFETKAEEYLREQLKKLTW